MASNKTNVNLPIPEVEIHLDGEWQKVSSLINGMPQSVLKGYRRGTIKCSRALVLIVKRAINTGIPPPGGSTSWTPLSPNTIKAHGQHNIYHMTGFYANSIGIHYYKNRTIVGLPSRAALPGKHITLTKLAIILEHGSLDGSIPPRKLWGPALKSYGKNKIKLTIMKEIRSSLMADFRLNSSQIRSSK